jgi:hypothetical protein
VSALRESTVLDMLDRRYTRPGAQPNAPDRYVRARHVRDAASWARRVCDYMAMDTYRAGEGWDVQYALHGHEVKVTRADWLAELRDPEKAEAFRPFCTHWWLVAGDATIVRGDLPEGWGLLVVQGSRLVTKVRPTPVEPLPLPRAMLAGLLRAATKSATVAS